MRNTYLFALLFAAVSLAGCKKEKDTDLQPPTAQPQNAEVEQLKINEIQVIGSHNSYRKRTYPPIYELCLNFYNNGLLPADLDPKGWDYEHAPLPEQFGAYGMRSIEIDVYEDPNGGRFASRGGLMLVDENMASGIPELNEPGYKVLHIPDFDYNTNYYTFRSALHAIRNWSLKNPGHVPIFVQIEAKTEMVGDQVNFPFLLQSTPYTAASAEAIDAEVRSVFGNDLAGVFTPDQLRGTFGTLREAVLANNWPSLANARGKVVFMMQGGLVPFYKQGHPSLQGRAMFTYAEPDEDEAAFVIINDPINDFALIQQTIADGFIVRTRADAETVEARTGDYTMMNAAISSGAQIISTDYYRPDPRYKTEPAAWTDYRVAFPGGITYRINPVTAPGKVQLGFIGE